MAQKTLTNYLKIPNYDGTLFKKKNKKAEAQKKAKTNDQGKKQTDLVNLKLVQMIKKPILEKLLATNHEFKELFETFEQKQWELWNEGLGIIHKSGAILYGDQKTFQEFFRIYKINDNFTPLKKPEIDANLKSKENVIQFQKLHFQKKYLLKSINCIGSDIKYYINEDNEILFLLNSEFGCMICPYYP